MKFLKQKLAKLNKQQMIILGSVILLLIGAVSYLLWQKYKAETAVTELEPPLIVSADSAIFAGKITDTDNKAIAGAQIVVEPFMVTSADDGSFLLTGITPGYYPITFFKDGKQLVRQDEMGGGVSISGEASAPRTFVLAPVGATSAPTPPDTTKPTINLISPKNNDKVDRTLSVSAKIEDNNLGETVAFLGSTQIPLLPCLLGRRCGNLNTSQIANGDYQFYVKATDQAGNTTETAKITIRVNHSQSGGGGGCAKR